MTGYAWLLLLLSFVAMTLFLVIAALYVIRINKVLFDLGGSEDCDLAKIGWGLRAIDRETSVIPSAVPELNRQLRLVRDGLRSIDQSVVAATQAQR